MSLMPPTPQSGWGTRISLFCPVVSKFLSLFQLLAALWPELLRKDFKRKTVQSPAFIEMPVPSLCDLVFPSFGFLPDL